MTGITQGMKNYIGEFFDDSRVTTAGFNEMTEKYGVAGMDEIINHIGPKIVGESNTGDAVYSFPGRLAAEFGNDYATAHRIHEEEGLTKYDIDDSGFTRTPGKMDTIH